MNWADRMHLRRSSSLIPLLLALALLPAPPVRAQASLPHGAPAWLRYAPPLHAGIQAKYSAMPPALVDLDSSPEAASARKELLHGVRSMLSRTLRIEKSIPNNNAWILGTTQEVQQALPQYRPPALAAEGFSISTLSAHGHTYWIIAGDGPRAVPAGAAEGEERARLWARWQEVDKNLDAYAALRSSETAVVVLEPEQVP